MAHNIEFEHALKNHIAIILGYADLLLEDIGVGDPRGDDIREIRKAARDAIALLDRHVRPPV
jgi:hypothetical protein